MPRSRAASSTAAPYCSSTSTAGAPESRRSRAASRPSKIEQLGRGDPLGVGGGRLARDPEQAADRPPVIEREHEQRQRVALTARIGRLCGTFRPNRSHSIRICAQIWPIGVDSRPDERGRSPMSLVADEIRDQPRAWSQAIALGASAARTLPARASGSPSPAAAAPGTRPRRWPRCASERRGGDRRVQRLRGRPRPRLRPRRRDLAVRGDDRDPASARAGARRARRRSRWSATRRARSPPAATTSST